jgi:hypothetical protein
MRSVTDPTRLLCLAAALLLAAACPAQAQSDAQVDLAIMRGMEYLLDRVSKTGQLNCPNFRMQDGTAEALTAQAALAARVPENHPQFRALLTWLDAHQPRRTAALAARLELNCQRGRLDQARADLAELLKLQRLSGGWPVGPAEPTANTLDTALALHAIDRAIQADLPVSSKVWAAAERFLTRSQNFDGGFGYYPPGAKPLRIRGASNGLSTAAGASALGILAAQRARTAPPGRSPQDIAPMARSTQLARWQRAIDWLSRNDNLTRPAQWLWGPAPDALYRLLLTRVGWPLEPMRLNGRTIDLDLTRTILPRQQLDGHFPGQGLAENTIAATACDVLALTQLRRPMWMLKLALGSDPRVNYADAANLLQWCNKQTGRDGAWRLIAPPVEPETLSQAPLLFLTGMGTFSFDDTTARAIRSFLEEGGMVLVQPIAGSNSFAESARKQFATLMPAWKAQLLPKTHPLLRKPARVDGVAGLLLGPADGAPQVLILQTDLSGAWHASKSDSARDAFELFGNVLRASAGGSLPTETFDRMLHLRNALQIARLVHGGQWNLAPQAVPTLSDDLDRALGATITEMPALPGQPVDKSVRLLWIAGNDIDLTEAHRQTIARYIDAGGTVLAEASDGTDATFKHLHGVIESLFGVGSLKPLAENAPLLTGRIGGNLGAIVTEASLTSPAAKQLRRSEIRPDLLVVRKNGRIVVVLSRLGLAPGAGGIKPDRYVGYQSLDARRIILNVLLLAASNHPASR